MTNEGTSKVDRVRDVTEAEAAAELRLSRGTIRNLRIGGALDFWKPSPRRVLIKRESLDAYKSARRGEA